MLNLNYTLYPTFYGCYEEDVPIVLYANDLFFPQLLLPKLIDFHDPGMRLTLRTQSTRTLPLLASKHSLYAPHVIYTYLHLKLSQPGQHSVRKTLEQQSFPLLPS